MSNIINIGGVTVDKFYLGNDSGIKIFLGTTKLYPNEIKNYLRTVARGTGAISLTIGSAVTTSSMTSVSYSLDGYSWTTANNVDDQTVTLTTPTLASGDTVYWKGVGVQTAILTPNAYRYNGTTFSASTQYDADGNIMSMLNGDNFENSSLDSSVEYHFCGLFSKNTNLIHASGMTLPADPVYQNTYNDLFNGCTNMVSSPLVLSATSLSGASCYQRMFYNCSALTQTISVLPATTLNNRCYENMFYHCTSLTTAPTLPATTLATQCYYYMFNGCRSLTTAPVLPATTLAEKCYSYMFYGCSGLTDAPVLSAETLVQNCYSYMFINCTSLSAITCLATSNVGSSACANWVYNVPSGGTFTRNVNMTGWTYGNSAVPSGWTVTPAYYAWNKADTSDYICDSETYTKYYKEYYQESYDLGNTWQNVTPVQSRQSEDVIEYDSTDCGYVGTNYFTIKSLVASNTITLKNATTGTTVGTTSFAYSTDSGSTWTNFTIPTGQTYTITTLGEGETVMLKGSNPTLGIGYNRGHNFRGTGNYVIQGNIMSLLTNNDTDTEFQAGTTNNFAMLFSGDTHLISAENLVVPASAMTVNAFNSTFRSCTNLQKAPELPATVLAKECYSSMFESCISLSQPPSVLSATSISVNDAYSRMFCMSRSSKLTTPAMTYSPKLYGNYTVAPYNQQMFCGNGNIELVECYWTYDGTISGLTNWMNYTNSSGTFKKLSSQEFGSGVSGIPTGWTVVNV